MGVGELLMMVLVLLLLPLLLMLVLPDVCCYRCLRQIEKTENESCCLLP